MGRGLGPGSLRVPPWSVALAIVVLTAVVYLPSLSGGFLIDDDVLLTDSRLIRAADGLWRFWFTTEAVDYWPVSNTSLWLEWRLWASNPFGYRVTNLLLHIVESLLLWRILLRLAIPGAGLAALLFAVHPVNVEAVAWISQRKTLLAMLFAQISAWLYLREEERRGRDRFAGRDYWLALAAFAMAMLSKVSIAIFPGLLAMMLWWRRPLRKSDVWRLLPFVTVAAVLLVVNVWFRARDPLIDVRSEPLEALLRGACAVWFYLSKALLPVDLAFMYPLWKIDPVRPMWWLPLLAAAVTTAVLLHYRNRWGRPWLFAWGFYCVALSPALGLTEVPYVEDHYQHLALVAVVAMAGAALALGMGGTSRSGRQIAAAVAVVVVVALSLLSWRRAAHFRDSVTLMRAAVEVYPDSPGAHRNLGFVLLRDQRPAEARASLETAVALAPDSIDARKALAVALASLGDREDAIAQLRALLRLGPGDPETLANLGAFLRESGRPAEALPYLERAVAILPDSVLLRCNIGKTLLELDRGREAMRHFEEALRLDPDLPEARRLLAIARARAADGDRERVAPGADPLAGSGRGDS